MPRDRDDVPRLPRGRGVRVSGPQLVKIAMLATLLVAVLVTMRPCSQAVGRFISNFGQAAAAGDAGATAAPRDGGPDPYGGPVIKVTPDMTPEQIQRQVDRVFGVDAGAAPAPATP